ncbi:MAG: hypothetical protein IJP00_00280 [Firmicutes bacterium]|nr:hypothetical protein [Bacillota bacterium]
MAEVTFKQLFFRYYDRTVGYGLLSFTQLGVSKNDFTRLCTEDGFVMDDETITRACNNMKLTEEETAEILAVASKERNKN